MMQTLNHTEASMSQKLVFNFTVETSEADQEKILSKISAIMDKAGFKVFNLEQIKEDE